MKLLQIEAPGRAAWKDAPTPEPAAGEVLLRVLGVTTCPHWDLHILGGVPMFPGAALNYPYQPGQPGHEAVGEVVALGPGVTGFRVGDRAVAWRDGPQPRNGFYAQYNNFRAEDLLRTPASLEPAEIASLELAMCVEASFEQLAALGGKLGRIGLGGLGPAGLVAVQLARAHGATEVVAFDPVPERRELAKSLGAQRVLAPDPAAWLPSRGADALDNAIDLTGLPASIEFLMDRTRRCVALFGVLREEVRFSGPRHLFGPGLILMGYGNHTRTAAETALRLVVEGKLKLEPLVTTTLPFTRYAEGVELLRTKRAIKVLFDPWL